MRVKEEVGHGGNALLGCWRMTVGTLLVLALMVGCGQDRAEEPANDRTAAADHSESIANSTASSGIDVGSDPQTDRTRDMAGLLRTIADKADPEKNPSLRRTKRIAELRDQLAKETKASRKVILRSHLAWYLMLDGQNEESVAEFKLANDNLHLVNLPQDHSFFRQFHELVGLSNLRLAEQQNCIMHHGCESCIVPIAGSGLHQYPEPARAAREQFARLLELYPNDLRSRWLMNIAHMALGEYPGKVPREFLIPPQVFESDYDVGRFIDVAISAGVATIGLSGGVVADDLDGDGLLDLMTSDWRLDGQLRLFHNNGDGTFRDDTRRAGLIGEVGGLNLVQADYDNDGHIDVFVLRGAWLDQQGEHPNSLLRNLGDGWFDDVTVSAGLLDYHPTQTAAWADFDLDGLLDLFVGNESRNDNSHPCQLFRNNGDGTFTDVAPALGIDYRGFVKGVTWGDFNNDRRPDLYLSCFGQPNVLFQNELTSDGRVQFVDKSAIANVRSPLGSFATWSWDFDNDGWVDIMVAPFSGFEFDGESLTTVVADYLGQQRKADRVHLYQNNRDGTFTDVAPRMGIDVPLLAMGANFGDIDNDGYLDCYFGTGDPHFSTIVPNRMFRNHVGVEFQDVTTSGGFGHIQKGHGIAFADFDNDGDQDIFSVMGGAIAGDVYQNVLFENPGHGNHWVTLRLQGTKSNRFGIGARIRITLDTNGTQRFVQSTVDSGGSFGASSLQQEIGLGSASIIKKLEIAWPNGEHTQSFENVVADRAYIVREDESRLQPADSHRFQFGRAESPSR